MKIMASDKDTQFMRERQPKNEDSLRMCSCKVFISNKTFYKHKINCPDLNPQAIKPEICSKSSYHKDKDYQIEILNNFRDSKPATQIILKSPLIKEVGYRHYCLRKHEQGKKDKVRKTVMSDMRELARLFLKFQETSKNEDEHTSVTVENMFERKFIKVLVDSIESLCKRDGNNQKEKYGLKMHINAIFQRSIKALKGIYSMNMQDKQYEELIKFQTAYNFMSPQLFAQARQECLSKSMDSARRPSHLPLENELTKLKEFISKEITKCMTDFNHTKYAWLRSLIICRVTLFNGRRGEEGSRILETEWQDAIDSVWLPKENIEVIEDEAEKFLAGQFKLAYLHGKGKKYVPLLIPLDLIEPVNLLRRFRQLYGVAKTNKFLFATKGSQSHASGWHSVRDVSKAANVSINATRNRHRISTIYAGLHMNPGDQKIFYDHMGHDANINKENYQCPAGVNKLRVMGQFLTSIDVGMLTF